MRILIADDHELFNELIKKVLLAEGLAASVTTCRNFDEAYLAVGTRKAAAGDNFDLVILDMRMPGMNGLSGLRRMLSVAGGTPVAIISGMLSPAEAREVMREGAAGFLPKTMPLEQLAEAIQRILGGERYVSSFLMTDEKAEAVASRTADSRGWADLTPREQEVLDELMLGWSNKRIAQHLGISEITVKSHLMHLFRKINARNRTDAVRIAIRSGGRSVADAQTTSTVQ